MRFAFAAITAAVLVMAAGCEPTCKQTCRKLLKCDGLDADVEAIDACEASCVFQEQSYEQADEDPRREDFAEHKSCLREATCGEIADGVCYDEDLFLY